MNNTQKDDELSVVANEAVESNNINEVSSTEDDIKSKEPLNDAVNTSETDTEANDTALPDEDSHPSSLYNDDGSINWDCPCLGGMAQGPCGDAFKEAYSCFAFSVAEPKGFDCGEQFQAMSECFQKHPEIYSALDDDLDDELGDEIGEEKVINNDIDEQITSNETEKPS